MSDIFYGVQKGKKPGVYNTWTECKKQITGFAYPKFRKFYNYKEAYEFVFPPKVKKRNFSISQSFWITDFHKNCEELEDDLKDLYEHEQNVMNQEKNTNIE